MSFINVVSWQQGEKLWFIAVTWIKDGQPLEASAKINQIVDGKKSFKLEISNVSAADIGQYGIKVAGKKNETLASFSLNVVTSEL